MSESQSIFNTIKSFLDANGIACRHVHHEPTRTSEESAQARGEPLEVGGKAILMKVGEEFKLFVFSAASEGPLRGRGLIHKRSKRISTRRNSASRARTSCCN